MYEASIVGSDRLTDIGVVKIENENLTPINLGNSEGVFVGDLAVAIGHPLTLGAAQLLPPVLYQHLIGD